MTQSSLYEREKTANEESTLRKERNKRHCQSEAEEEKNKALTINELYFGWTELILSANNYIDISLIIGSIAHCLLIMNNSAKQ